MRAVPVVQQGLVSQAGTTWTAVLVALFAVGLVVLWRLCSAGAPRPPPTKRPKKAAAPGPPAVRPELAHRVTDVRMADRVPLKPDPAPKKASPFPAGFPMMSPFGGLDLSLMGAPPVDGAAATPVERGVAVIVGAMDVHRGKADRRISSAVRDVRAMAEAFQGFDYDTYSLHDQREEFDARPTARGVLGMLRQVKLDKTANALAVYLCCHARVSAVDSEVEFLLQQLWLAYCPDPSDSGRIHSTVKERWRTGDPEVVVGMVALASLAEEACATLEARDWGAFAALMDRNFDLRRRMFGDACLGAANLEMIAIARAHGASAKFPGSGGAVVGICPKGPPQCAAVREALEAAGYVVVPVVPHGPDP